MCNRLTVCFAAILWLAGCGSSPRVDFYALQALEGSPAEAPADARVLGVGPLELPDYLQRPQLVSRGQGAALRLDESNRWAEPLERAIPRVVAASLDELLTDFVVTSFPVDNRTNIDYRLTGRVIRFDTDANGLAVLDLQWRVQDSDGRRVLPVRRQRFTAQSRSAGSAAARVAALNEALHAFSRAAGAEVASIAESAVE